MVVGISVQLLISGGTCTLYFKTGTFITSLVQIKMYLQQLSTVYLESRMFVLHGFKLFIHYLNTIIYRAFVPGGNVS